MDTFELVQNVIFVIIKTGKSGSNPKIIQKYLGTESPTILEYANENF